MTRLHRLAVSLLVLVIACTDSTDTPMEAAPGSIEAVAHGRVTSSADAGPGSFRQAVLDAASDPAIGTIRFEPRLGPIMLLTPVTYSGTQALTIRAGGTRLVGSRLGAGESAFVVDGGGDITISELAVSRAPGNGITIKVPAGATGTYRVRLDRVVIRENGLHGILVNDRAEYFDDPLSTSEEGSAAGLLVDVIGSASSGTGSRSSTRTGSGSTRVERAR